jgi:3-oxoacyl-[acyl-carrier-protein] synthase II
MYRRVVVTGYGAVSPLGNNSKIMFENLINSKSGVSHITRFDASHLACRIAGEVKLYSDTNTGGFNPESFVEKKDLKKLDDFMIYSIAGAQEALDMAGWHPTKEEDLFRTGVTVGSGIGGLSVIENTVNIGNTKGMNRISPFFIPSALINLASGHISMKYGFLGPNHSPVTACATGAHAIYNAYQMIAMDDADVVVCGGTESSVCNIGIAGFIAAGALSTRFNDTPEKASRPWDKDRDGFVMGEGAGILVLEEYEHAKKRGANIIAEYLGAGLSGDAYHLTAPHPQGRGAKNAMKMALAKAKINPENIDYVNAHGTSTPMGDEIELNAVKDVFGTKKDKILMSSTKGATGHLLGAAGSLETIISIMAMQHSVAPPTLNLDNPMDGIEGFDLVPHTAKECKIDCILSNSFGFGGTNASIIIGKIKNL